MINIRSIKKLQENDGLTLKNGKPVLYRTGYQVATEKDSIETTDAKIAIQHVKALKGNCGVWFSEGIYYIDKSFRVSTKKQALQIGRENKQISILKWSNMSLIYC